MINPELLTYSAIGRRIQFDSLKSELERALALVDRAHRKAMLRDLRGTVKAGCLTHRALRLARRIVAAIAGLDKFERDWIQAQLSKLQSKIAALSQRNPVAAKESQQATATG